MAYNREVDKDEQIVISGKPVVVERGIEMNDSLKLDCPVNGIIIITLKEKSGRRARLSIESENELNMEHIGAVKPKRSTY